LKQAMTRNLLVASSDTVEEIAMGKAA